MRDTVTIVGGIRKEAGAVSGEALAIKYSDPLKGPGRAEVKAREVAGGAGAGECSQIEAGQGEGVKAIVRNSIQPFSVETSRVGTD